MEPARDVARCYGVSSASHTPKGTQHGACEQETCGYAEESTDDYAQEKVKAKLAEEIVCRSERGSLHKVEARGNDTADGHSNG